MRSLSGASRKKESLMLLKDLCSTWNGRGVRPTNVHENTNALGRNYKQEEIKINGETENLFEKP